MEFGAALRDSGLDGWHVDFDVTPRLCPSQCLCSPSAINPHLRPGTRGTSIHSSTSPAPEPWRHQCRPRRSLSSESATKHPSMLCGSTMPTPSSGRGAARILPTDGSQGLVINQSCQRHLGHPPASEDSTSHPPVRAQSECLSKQGRHLSRPPPLPRRSRCKRLRNHSLLSQKHHLVNDLARAPHSAPHNLKPPHRHRQRPTSAHSRPSAQRSRA